MPSPQENLEAIEQKMHAYIEQQNAKEAKVQVDRDEWIQEINANEKLRQGTQDQMTENAVRERIVKEWSPQDSAGQVVAEQPQLSLREYLQRRRLDHQKAIGPVYRAIEILDRHPEFELYLELQDLINDGL